MAYETRNDAVRAVCAVHECDAAEAGDHIRSVPFMADVQTVIDMTIKAVESVETRKGTSDEQ